MKKLIAIIGEYNPTFKLHVATNAAIKHSAIESAIDVDADWVSTDEIDSSLFETPTRPLGLGVNAGHFASKSLKHQRGRKDVYT